MIQNSSYLNTFLGNISAMLQLHYYYKSEEGLKIFEEMANDTISVDFADITKEKANSLLLLLNISNVVLSIPNAEDTNLVPVVAFDGFRNLKAQIEPLEPYLKDITNDISNADVEHRWLSWAVCNQDNFHLQNLD